MVNVQLIKQAFEKHETIYLKKLSDHILADGALENKKYLIRLAVITHALSNILEKSYYTKKKGEWGRFVKKIQDNLGEVREESNAVEKLEAAIIELDESFGRYSDNVLYRSKIRKGSSLYAWGLALSYAASLVGVDENEILTQSGQTKMVDEEGATTGAEKRLKHLEGLM